MKNYVYLFSDPSVSSEIENSLLEFFKNNDIDGVNPFVLWNSHKAYIRGLLMKHSALLRRREQHMDSVLREIADLELQNKPCPFHSMFAIHI